MPNKTIKFSSEVAYRLNKGYGANNQPVYFDSSGIPTAITATNLASFVDGQHKWVRVAGDTMTGNLTMKKSEPIIVLTNSSVGAVASSDNNVSTNVKSGISFYNANSANWMGDFSQGYDTTGRTWQRIYLRNFKEDGTTQVNNYIYLYANKDGTTSYAVSNAAAFRTAIGIHTSINSGTAGRLAYYSSASALSQTSNIHVLNNYLISSSRNSTSVDIRANGLIIWGQTYGNTAAEMLSNTAGVFRFSDGGPQIVFNTSNSWNAQAGALIFTDHDTAGTGTSFHFVSTESSNNNGGNCTVTAPRFRARTGLTVGQNSDNTSYTFYVNGNGAANTGFFTPSGSIYAGTDGNTAAERQVGVRSGAGTIYMYAQASTTGNRGIYVPAHGSGGAHGVITIGTNNEVYFADGYTGTSTRLAYSQSALAASAISYLACWNGYELRAISKAEVANAADASHKWVRLAGDTMTGNLTISGAGAHWTKWVNTTTQVSIEMWSDTTNQGIYTRGYWNGSAYVAGAGWILYRGTDSYVHSSFRLYSAVWNDYAECRTCETSKGGVVVADDGTGVMKITTQRMQPVAHIVSDTYGMCVGDSDTAKTPIGVSGRVLVYTYQDRMNYTIGDCVCAAPNGTVDIMTRDEIKEYPDRIVGIVSEIPNYETWNSRHTDGEVDVSVKIDGRIWIYVK